MAMPILGSYDLDHRRDSGHGARKPAFDENMTAPIYMSTESSQAAKPTSGTIPHQHGSSLPLSWERDPALRESSPKPPRDSMIEPDTYATFTSTSAHPQQPASYQAELPGPLRLSKYAVHNLVTGDALIGIQRSAVHLPEPFSSKPLLTLMRSATGQSVGTIRFHKITTSAVDLELTGMGTTRMTHDGHFSKRWKLSSIVAKEQRDLFWCKSRDDGWELKEASKKGKSIARLGLADGMILRFEKAELSEIEIEEVILGAVAVLEALRRGQKENEWGTLERGESRV